MLSFHPRVATRPLNDIVLNTLELTCYPSVSDRFAWRLTAHDAFFNQNHKDFIMLNQAYIEYPFCTIKAQRCQVDRENQSLHMEGGVKTVLNL